MNRRERNYSIDNKNESLFRMHENEEKINFRENLKNCPYIEKSR